ncbi:hypothetical protein Pedsa_2503 [Pseudopedobacter saltans DSM 12145]|uniref:Uncharacterized protein n=1 Tax=Pseudopedobacter saltans (strain ATCC 51119 / DSM 12145 / JCM 21818 / CCUG 39354 / LMG 10337 / NBRC 100064 / NCIMB 13643) TaxID=762903 RepID=F0S4N0_PSESL|nr:hypothetical protein [Pseudopedobacter saltans]ADY53048.1 hypothetical protein Pedsa_2503 [Pseudopedobacter saltans DSM 12145]
MRYYILLSIFTLFLFNSCKEKDNNAICLTECGSVSQTLRLSIVEEEGNSSYLISQSKQKGDIQLQLYSLRLKKEIPYTIEKGTNYISFQIIGSDEIEVRLNGNLEDTIKIETRYIKDDCCGGLEIVKLSVNNSFINKPENSIIVIKK